MLMSQLTVCTWCDDTTPLHLPHLPGTTCCWSSTELYSWSSVNWSPQFRATPPRASSTVGFGLDLGLYTFRSKSAMQHPSYFLARPNAGRTANWTSCYDGNHNRELDSKSVVGTQTAAGPDKDDDDTRGASLPSNYACQQGDIPVGLLIKLGEPAMS